MDSIVAWPGVFGSFPLFLLLFAIGVLSGCVFARPLKPCAWTASLAMMGVCGAWLGAEFAYLFGQAAPGGGEQLVVAALGGGALAYAHRRAHRRVVDPDSDIALSGPRP